MVDDKDRKQDIAEESDEVDEIDNRLHTILFYEGLFFVVILN